MLTTIVILVLSAFAPASAPSSGSSQPATKGSTRPTSRPVSVTYSDATRVYEAELRNAADEWRAARIAAKRAYAADLTALINNAVRTVDLERANQAKATRDRVNEDLQALREGREPAGDMPRPSTAPVMPVGTWHVSYASGVHRTYRITADGTVTELTPPVQTSGRLIVENGELRLTRAVESTKVERLTLAGGRLFVEHFDPASRINDDAPTTLGIGRRRP